MDIRPERPGLPLLFRNAFATAAYIIIGAYILDKPRQLFYTTHYRSVVTW